MVGYKDRSLSFVGPQINGYGSVYLRRHRGTQYYRTRPVFGSKNSLILVRNSGFCTQKFGLNLGPTLLIGNFFWPRPSPTHDHLYYRLKNQNFYFRLKIVQKNKNYIYNFFFFLFSEITIPSPAVSIHLLPPSPPLPQPSALSSPFAISLDSIWHKNHQAGTDPTWVQLNPCKSEKKEEKWLKNNNYALKYKYPARALIQ